MGNGVHEGTWGMGFMREKVYEGEYMGNGVYEGTWGMGFMRVHGEWGS